MERISRYLRRPGYYFAGWVALAIVVLIGCSTSRPVAAQGPAPRIARPPGPPFGVRPAPGQGDADEDLIEGLFLPVDRETTRQLSRANELLSKGRYSDAVTLLDEMLERDEDCFFKPRDDQPLHRSLKAEANRLIGSMPPEGRKAYELQFGARAAQMLKDAAARGDLPSLEEVARRFFHTQAGYEAALLLGRSHLDHDRPLAAALCFERVRDVPEADGAFEPGLSVLLATSWLRAGEEERARDVLLELKKNYPKSVVRIGAQKLNLFQSDDQALNWLAQALGRPAPAASTTFDAWTLFRGDPQRNATSAGGMPLLNPRWRVPTTNHPALEEALAGMRDRYIEQGIAALPSMHPLAVGDLVLMRTARNLLAVDFVSGKRVGMPTSGFSSDELLPGGPVGDARRFDPQLNPALAERFWNDVTFGTFSSDGQQVYIVDDLEIASGPAYNMPRRNRRGGRGFDPASMMNSSFNKLAAHELRSELKLKWSVGGADGDDEPKLAGAFFLGPPLPLQGKLYVLCEIKGEIKLLVLDPSSGRLQWSQQAAVVEQNITGEPIRRLAGCTPSYANGVLICPTAAGAVVAVDVANRSLLWGYQYPRNQQAMGQNAVMVRGAGVAVINGQWGPTGSAERWNDSTATIAENCALLTPPESDELHCLNLLDGTPLWTRPREENLYVAAVHHGNVILVGKHNVAAFKLADGTPAWDAGVVELPAEAMPSGRGFASGDDYYLPLTSAEVARIDLNTAQIAQRQKSRRGTIPGNLVCYHGEVISQGVDYLETFFQIEPLQKRIAEALAKNPEDPWALAHRGEIALEQGHLVEAIDDVRRSYHAEPAPFTRDLLVEVLLAGLAEDFAAHRDALPELEQLATLHSQRSEYLRVVALGLQKEGNRLGALEAYLKLASLQPTSDDLEQIDGSLSVAEARWIRARCGELLSDARPDDRHKLDVQLRKRFEQTAASNNVSVLRYELDCFGDHPAADQVRERLVEQLNSPETLLEREQLLLRLTHSADPARRKAAMARLAKLLVEAGRPTEALAYYRRIEREFSDQPVLDGKSVRAILANLQPDSALTHEITTEQPWPTGIVQIEKRGPRAPIAQPQFRAAAVDLRGDPGPFFDDVTVGFDQQSNSILVRDSLGRERFKVSLMEGGGRMPPGVAGGPPSYSATVNGHCLVVCTINQIVSIDALRSSTAAGTRVLWKEDLVDPGNLYGSNGPVIQPPRPWGGGRDIARSQGHEARIVGPATDNGVVILRGRELFALDLLTGKRLWVLRGMPLGSDVFGDSQNIVVAPPDDGAALIVRALDGQLLGTRQIPPASERWTNIGRNLLTSREGNQGKLIVALYDPLAERELWSRQFSTDSRGAVVDDDSLAMMQSDGKFVMLALADGRPLVDQTLEPEPSLQSIYVMRSADRNFLITNRPYSGHSPNRNYLPPFPEAPPMINGRVYAFDRASGGPVWPAPVTIEQHGLVLSQACDLPVLIFVRNINSFPQPNRSEARGSLLCIDKRTGGLVYEDNEVPQQIGMFEAVGDPEDRSVSLITNTHAVTLRYTDASAPPEPPYQAGLYDKVKPAPRDNAALLRALGIGEDSQEGNPKNSEQSIRRRTPKPAQGIRPALPKKE